MELQKEFKETFQRRKIEIVLLRHVTFFADLDEPLLELA